MLVDGEFRNLVIYAKGLFCVNAPFQFPGLRVLVSLIQEAGAVPAYRSDYGSLLLVTKSRPMHTPSDDPS